MPAGSMPTAWSGGFHADSFGGGGYHAGGFATAATAVTMPTAFEERRHAALGRLWRQAAMRGYHAGYGGSVNRGQLNSFLGLPTDGGFHAAGGAEGHVYQGPGGTTVAHGAAGVQGAAVGPDGAAAGGRYASGTAIRGPEGNVYTHETTAGRGVAAGPDGVAAGRYAAAGRPSTACGRRPRLCGLRHASLVAHLLPCPGHGRPGLVLRQSLYTPGWCTIHPWAWCPAGYAAADWAAAAWATATWASLGSWLGYADAEPYSYNYGNSHRLPGRRRLLWRPAGRHRAAVLPGGREPGRLDRQRHPGPDAQWLPLGVFGLMANGKKTPDMVFQLAVDKQRHDPRQLLRPGHANQSARHRGGRQEIAAGRLEGRRRPGAGRGNGPVQPHARRIDGPGPFRGRPHRARPARAHQAAGGRSNRSNN